MVRKELDISSLEEMCKEMEEMEYSSDALTNSRRFVEFAHALKFVYDEGVKMFLVLDAGVVDQNVQSEIITHYTLLMSLYSVVGDSKWSGYDSNYSVDTHKKMIEEISESLKIISDDLRLAVQDMMSGSYLRAMEVFETREALLMHIPGADPIVVKENEELMNVVRRVQSKRSYH